MLCCFVMLLHFFRFWSLTHDPVVDVEFVGQAGYQYYRASYYIIYANGFAYETWRVKRINWMGVRQ
jgi:hypothetical protein